ncbi:MAG: hypothetical protein IEMM0006_1682 [bacterium]|nr:MAG: hypothetical protein IEMM0006_1682 [bacterium]
MLYFLFSASLSPFTDKKLPVTEFLFRTLFHLTIFALKIKNR